MTIKLNVTSKSVRKALFGTAALSILCAPSSFAQDQAADAAVEEPQERIAVVGTRSAPRSIEDSAVPVDIIGGDELTSQGISDMDALLAVTIPSYNVNAQPISDAATLVRPANLRGLSPDSTLILVNGKRRHRAAVISFLGGGVADGAQGPDLSVIPGIAIKQVEVLRDGAAAQYGSDAIAGVINFQLRDDAEGGLIELKAGEYKEGDGDLMQMSGFIGMPLTENGHATFAAEYKTQDPTSRSVQRDDAAGLIAAGNTHVADPAQIWGSPETKYEFKGWMNLGIDLSNTSEFYMFGNYAERDVEGGFYFRNPNTRGGVFRGPEVDGNPTILTGDLTEGALDNSNCPIVPIINNVPDANALASLDDYNCFAFNSMFPGGFTPRFGGKLVDYSFAIGTKGELDNEVAYDVSVVTGTNDVEFYIKNTINPSLGPVTPTSFRPGSYVQSEHTFNIDLSKPIEAGLAEPINVAGGVEYRHETFEIKNGDAASFEVGPLAPQGFGIGSNGFPGFKPQDAGKFSRHNWAAYLDVEAYLTDDFLLGGAVRHERFSDFGSKTIGKVTARFQATDNVALRGSVQTGFRAPTVGQSNVRNVTTAFGANGLEDQATLPPTNPISIQKGATPLKAETSRGMTVGTVFNLGDWKFTADFYQIKVKDRISQTSPLALSASDIADLLAQGVLDATSYTSVKYFTNDFDTTTTGVDIVGNYAWEMMGGNSNLALVYNHNRTKVDDYNPANTSETKVRLLEENLPKDRMSATWSHSNDSWRFLVRANYYGKTYEDHLDSEAFPINMKAKTTMDAEVGYSFNDNWNATVGAQNIFNTYPELNEWAGVAGSKYPNTSPLGMNGGFYYVRAQYKF